MPKKLCLLKSENDHEMLLSQTVDQKGIVRKKDRKFYVLAAFCYNLKFLYRS